MMPTRVLACAVAVVAAGSGAAFADSLERNFAGSIQLDYMAIPTESVGRKIALDAATAEVSMKVTQDFGDNVSASIKLCVACHGIEAGMAFFDLRLADELNFRVGRFTPQFGSFPIRHDPANHRTADKPCRTTWAACCATASGTWASCRRRGSTTASSSAAPTT